MATSPAAPDGRSPAAARPEAVAHRSGRTSAWVVGILVGLVLMMLVNFAFIYIAVRGADQVVPSYQLEHR